MAIAEITCNEWTLDKKGRLIPRLHFTPVKVKEKLFGQLPAYNFEWVKERGLGVGALIYIDVRPPGRTGYISYVNIPKVPNFQTYCECGKLFSLVGKHLQCLEPAKKCTRRGIHSWQNTLPIDWVKASIIYPADMWKYFRDTPDYLKPRKVD